MTESEYMEISRRINSRIYQHTHAIGSVGTYAVNKAKADECIQILKVIEKVMVAESSKPAGSEKQSEYELIERINNKVKFEFNWLCDVLRENGKVTTHDIILARDGCLFTIDGKEVDK